MDNDTEVKMSFLDTCVKCNKPMKSKSGQIMGGIMTSVSIDGDYIYGTTCWECVFEKQ